MNKFEIIQMLEGKLVPAPSGAYHLVRNGVVHTEFGSFSLLQYEVGQLEIMLRRAR